MLRYRITSAEGKRVENTLPVGFVRDLPKEKDAWREVDRLGLLLRINDDSGDVRVRFDTLAEFYLKTDCGPDALRPKTERTTLNTEHIVRDYLVPQWGKEIADDIKPLDIQRWIKSLHTGNGIAWTTISKFRGTMLRIYRIGALHELVTKNPVLPVETRSTTDYKAILVTPRQTLSIIMGLPNPLHRILVLTCAATALRFSELLSLRWADVEWEHSRIAVTKRWSRGKDGPTKTQIRGPCATTSHSCRLPQGVARAHALCLGYGFSIPVSQGRRQSATLPCCLCCRPSAADRQSGRNRH